MSAVTRCKMKVNQVTYTKNQEGTVDSENVQLSAVYSNDPQAENNQWSKWTPSASFSITINNPNAIGKLSNGHEYYVDFIPVSGN